MWHIDYQEIKTEFFINKFFLTSLGCWTLFYATKVHVHLLNWLMHSSICRSIQLASSDGKESACNAGDLGSLPGLGDPLEMGKATHSSILA